MKGNNDYCNVLLSKQIHRLSARLRYVGLFEKHVENFAHFVFPLDSHHQHIALCAEISSLELSDLRFYVDFSILSFVYSPTPNIKLPFFDSFHVLDKQICCCY